MPNPVIEHVWNDDVLYDVKDIYAERAENKRTSVQGFQSTPDDQHYPSEKLVKQSLDEINSALAGAGTVVVDSLPAVAEANAAQNYILKNGDAGLLYRVINNAWRLIGGSIVKVVSSLPVSGDEYTDYYAQDMNGDYIHYRWKNGENGDPGSFYATGVTAYTKNEVDLALSGKENVSNRVTSWGEIPSDTKYPSEKLVKDSIDSLDTAINSIDISTTFVVTELPSVASADTSFNYILKRGSGALLYRVIDGAWKMVGGSMISIVSDVESLPQTGDSSTDYYVGTGTTNPYLHYRWLDGVGGADGGYYSVGVDAYSKTEVDALVTADRARLTALEGAASTLDGRVDTVEAQMTSISNMVDDVASAGTTTGGLTITYQNGATASIPTYDVRKRVEEIQKSATGISVTYTDGSSEDIEISGGGGGGPSDVGAASITRITASETTGVYGDELNIQYRFEATDSSGEQVGPGTATWYVNDVRKATSTAYQNVVNTFDIGPYLNVGLNAVRVSISVDTGGEAPLVRTKPWTVNAVNMYIVWDYDETTVNTADRVSIRWTPYGNVSKTTYIIIDGDTLNPITSTTSRSGVEQYVTIDKLAHGAHHVEMYCKAMINSTEITSSSVHHSMIFADPENTATIIACPIQTETMTQYNTLSIPVAIYKPGSLTADAVLRVDGAVVAEWTNIDRTQHYWNYTPNTAGPKALTITSGTASVTIILTVVPIDIDNEEVSGYAFKLKAADLAGNDALRAWSSNGVNATFSNNFDWSNGGIKSEVDDSGNARQYICVKAGTYMTINYELFGNEAKSNGKNIKVIFKVTNSRDYDAVFLRCLDSGIGIQLGANGGFASSEQNTVNVAYAEDSYTEFEYDISADSGFRYMQTYIDGVLSSTNIYAANDNFTQTNRQNVVIGSPDCDVYIYLVKAYEAYLSIDNHIENFIADAPNASEMVARYNRNDILNDDGEISYTRLSEKNPNCRVHLWDIPRMSTDKMKNDPVSGCSYQQIYVAGRDCDQITADNVTIGVQGTSSINYISSAANTDGDFTEGFTDKNGVHYDGYAMSEDSIPVSYFNTKVNVASCENVNNMCIAEWYNRFLPYKSGARARIENSRDCMEHHIGVQFIRDRSGSLFHADDPDGDNYHMYAIVNMGNSKNNAEVFHDEENPLECCFETKANDANMCMMTEELTVAALDSEEYFEFRYPVDKKKRTTAMKEAFIDFCNWMAASNPAGATNAALSAPVTYGPYTFRGTSSWDPNEQTEILTGLTISDYAGTYTHDTYEYRMAKMLDECEDHLVMDSIVFHYVFVEHHAMVDNVCKNTFWGTDDLVHWHLCKNYDNDTADGNDNTGHLTIPFGAEGMDTLGTGDVFNGKLSVYWQFVYGLYPARQLMWRNRENAGCWNADDYLDIATGWQNYLPERVYNQDYWYKYLRPYEQNNDTTYIAMLEGGKKNHQRDAFVHNNMWYMASQYTGAMCLSDSITLRGYTPSESESNTPEVNARIRATITAVPPKAEVQVMLYNKGYVLVEVASSLRRVKAEKGTYYTMAFPDSGAMNDTVINIHAARNVRAVNGLAQLYIGSSNFSAATKLRSLSVGSEETGYWNGNIDPQHPVSFGANTMLEELYIQNCPNASYTLDISNCQSIRELDVRGSGFTGINFAVGCLVEKAYLCSPASLSMISLRYLTDRHFSLESYANLRTLRFEDTPGVDSLLLVTNAVNLSRLRMTGIDWTIADTSLLNRMLRLMGLDENDHNTDMSVLAGDVYVAGSIRYSEIDNYESAWGGQLVVTYDPNKILTQYLVTYANPDGTVLYQTLIDSGNQPINPVAEGLIDTPTREPDSQYIYTFIGWTDINIPVTEAKTIIARYSTEDRTYSVRWYRHVGDVIPAYTAEAVYGEDAVYQGTLPTTEYTQGFYGIFTGWDKSTGYITGDTNAYGVWETATSVDASKGLNQLTPIEMYVVSRQHGAASGRYNVKDYFDVRLGWDFNFSNVESETLIAAPRFFDGTDYLDTNIELFRLDSPSFVLAIDYEFVATENRRGGVLASCVQTSGSGGSGTGNGFMLSATESSDIAQSISNIRWADTSRRVGRSTQRNMVVIRHRKGSNSLMVYSFNGADDSNVNSLAYDRDITAFSLGGPGIPNIDSKLTFGALRYDEQGGVRHNNYAVGTVYWSKIWYDDLGDDVCQKLASWTHDTMRMEYAGANRHVISTSNEDYCDASFYSNSLLPLRVQYSNATASSTATWEGSYIQQFCRERLLKAFEYQWQSIITPVKVITAPRNGDPVPTNCITSIERLYLPAYCEVRSFVGTSGNAQYLNEFDQAGTHYQDAYVSGLFGVGGGASYAIGNFRWAGLIINDIGKTGGARVFTDTREPSTFAVPRDGDIWYCNGNSSGTYCYMYVSNSTYQKHSMLGSIQLWDRSTSSNIMTSANGYWIRSENWWTRSPDRDRGGNFVYKRYLSTNTDFSYQTYSAYAGVLIGFSI